MTPGVSHTELVSHAASWLRRQGCGVIFHDGFRAATTTGEQPDAIGWRHYVSVLVECKATRADFFADAAKPFRTLYSRSQGMGDWRFFLCPESVIWPNDLPHGWGLIWLTRRGLRSVHGVPGNTRWADERPFFGNKECEFQMFYSALQRMELRGHLSSLYEPLAARRAAEAGA